MCVKKRSLFFERKTLTFIRQSWSATDAIFIKLDDTPFAGGAENAVLCDLIGHPGMSKAAKDIVDDTFLEKYGDELDVLPETDQVIWEPMNYRTGINNEDTDNDASTPRLNDDAIEIFCHAGDGVEFCFLLAPCPSWKASCVGCPR